METLDEYAVAYYRCMHLSRPLYEGVPLVYASIGAFALLLAHDQPGSWVSLCIGLCAEVAALTVFLRRQDMRALGREYVGGGVLEAPPQRAADFKRAADFHALSTLSVS